MNFLIRGQRLGVPSVNWNRVSDFLCGNILGFDESGVNARTGASAVDQSGNGKGLLII